MVHEEENDADMFEVGVSPIRQQESLAHEEGRPRLMIQKMVLENFKSYGGVREIGPFHKRFSSIVGPNGSGKSNVIDAMLFVFGKRAKKLRLNKVSELIHNSEQFATASSAKVTVFFADVIDEEGDTFRIVPNTEIAISRVAYANNTSKYFIDEKSSSYSQVGEILRQRGVDLDNNRFLILQGEVEQIALMKPKAPNEHEDGLLEYLEDIIGSNKYLEQISAAAITVEDKCEARLEKLNRLKVTETERRGLEDAKLIAEAFVIKEDQIRRHRSILYQIYISQAQDNIASIEAKCTNLTQQADTKQNEYQQLCLRLDEATQFFATLQKNCKASNNKLAQCETEYEHYEKAEIEAREAVKYRKKTITKLQAQIITMDKEIQAKNLAIEQGQTSKPLLEDTLAQAQAAAKQAEESLLAAQARNDQATQNARAALDEARAKQLVPAQTNMSTAQVEVDAAKTKLDLAYKAREEIQRRASNLATKAEQAVKHRDTKASQIHETEAELARGRDRETKLDAQLKSAIAVEARARNEARQALSSAEGAKAIAQRREALNKTSGAVRAILDAAARKEVSGVRGRLGDLGTISSDLDVAVSTASDMLDHVVVDTTSDAQQCIEYLRVKGLGRASFIVLDQLNQWHAKIKERKVNAHSCLFDAIKPDSKDLVAAFYLAFRETLVAPDLEAAVKLANNDGGRGRNRVVSNQGQLIETTGAMTGGGGKPKSGKMRLHGSNASSFISEEVFTVAEQADSASSLQELDRRATTAGHEAEEAARRSSRLDADLRSLRMELEQIESRLPQLRAELEAATAAAMRLLAQADEAEAQANKAQHDTDITNHLEPEYKAAVKAFDNAKSQVAEAEAIIEKLRDQVLDAAGDELRIATNETDKTRAAEEVARSALADSVRVISAAKRALTKAQAAKTKAETELERLQRNEDETDFLEKVAAATLQAKKALDEANKQAHTDNQAREKAEVELSQLKQGTQELKTAEAELRHQAQDFARAVKENKTKLSHWNKEITKLQKLHQQQITAYRDVLTTYHEVESEERNDDADKNQEDVEMNEDPVAPGEDVCDLPELTCDELRTKDKEEVKYNLALLEGERDAARSDVNLKTIEEYRAKSEEYQQRLDELEAVTRDRNRARDRLEDLKRRRLDDFMLGFGVISLKLKEMYQMITLGGDAELELVDSLDPFSEGIVFSVRPPKKSWKHIANLSGGEKTLSSLALVFALHHYKPTCFYIMDEIDAALDFKNVSIIANYIKDRCQSAQFIIISLRNQMFELADRLVGIYKTHNVTKTITIAPDHFIKAISSPPVDQQPPSSGSDSSILRDTTNNV
mmetsp:Transcript_6086/g.9026  ORF Transcript_6086/g.9026 Transcript_6086/m.9026 type:complete len:1325 (+) Transcript_6086:13-3987(+)